METGESSVREGLQLIEQNSGIFAMEVAILIAVVLLLLLMSALISASEVAFFSLGKKDIENITSKNKHKGKAIANILENPKKLLATILILNNLVNIAIVTINTYIFWNLFEGGTESAQNKGLIVLLVTSSSTFLIVFFGEVLPKVYANQNNTNFAKLVINPLSVMNKLLTPLSHLLVSSSSIIDKKIKKRIKTITSDELNKALDITTNSQDFSQEEKDILRGIANFGNTTVKQIKIARTDIESLDIDLHFHKLMDKINKCGHSRIPVYEDTIDTIVGILYIKDLLAHINENEDFNWRKFIRPAYFVPETKKIDDLLRDFQKKKVHMAIVVDEYGGTSGLITMEDVIEEIVGEINDEFDEDNTSYTALNENTFVFEGKISLHDFCKILDADSSIFDEVKGENESLGGLMLELFSKIPHVGQTINFQHFKFTIESVDLKKVKKIKVELLPKEHEAA